MPKMGLMTVYCGSLRETEVVAGVEDLGGGAGRVACLECGGSGWWDFAAPEVPPRPCVPCKGSGWELVSVA